MGVHTDRGVWSQAGQKLVPRDAAGPPETGVSTALSGDGRLAAMEGYDDNGAVGATWLFLNGRPRISSVNDIPFDEGGMVALGWKNSAADEPLSPTPITYLVWRGLQLPVGSPIPVTFPVDQYRIKLAQGSLPPDAYTTLPPPSPGFRASTETYWQDMTSLPGHGFPEYSFACSTLADSTPQGIPWRYFLVTAATSDPTLYWDSLPDSGYSVDNLAPSAPGTASLNLLSNGPIALTWARDLTDPDVGHYAVYRSVINGFPISDSTRIRTTIDTIAVDSTTSRGLTYYYRVTTVDIHGNESGPTPQLGGTALSVSSRIVSPLTYGLDQNYPNPFNPSTVISYQLPVASTVRLVVYDLLGNEVAILVNEKEEPGSYNVRFNAAGLASGMYLYRLQAGWFAETRKLILMR